MSETVISLLSQLSTKLGIDIDWNSTITSSSLSEFLREYANYFLSSTIYQLLISLFFIIGSGIILIKIFPIFMNEWRDSETKYTKEKKVRGGLSYVDKDDFTKYRNFYGAILGSAAAILVISSFAFFVLMNDIILNLSNREIYGAERLCSKIESFIDSENESE